MVASFELRETSARCKPGTEVGAANLPCGREHPALWAGSRFTRKIFNVEQVPKTTVSPPFCAAQVLLTGEGSCLRARAADAKLSSADLTEQRLGLERPCYPPSRL